MEKILLLFIIPFLSFGQIVTEDCNSIPDPGICLAYIQTFYFNQTTSQCEESYWGGCGGLVPFWTLDDCQNSCENTEIEGCWEENEWYCVGCEYVIDECSYIECESNNNWSNIITSDECGVCVVMNTIIVDCFCDWPETAFFWEEFDEETCTLYEMCDCQNITIEEEIVYYNKSLLKTIDILGRETTNKGFQLHIYDDGSVEKKYVIK